MDNPRRDTGSIVVGWLTKLTLVLAVAGVLAFDAIAIGVNNVTAQDDANTAAQAAAADWHTNHDLRSAYAAAVLATHPDNERVLPRRFTVDPDGTVHLVLRRETRTLVLHHIGPLKQYEFAEAHGDAGPPPS